MNNVPDSQPVPVCKSTPWPGAGKMSGNLFEDRNWLLPPNYLSNDNKHKTVSEPKNTANVTSPRPSVKEEEPKINDQKNAVGDQIALFANPRRRRKRANHNNKRHCQRYKNHRPEDPIL